MRFDDFYEEGESFFFPLFFFYFFLGVSPPNSFVVTYEKKTLLRNASFSRSSRFLCFVRDLNLVRIYICAHRVARRVLVVFAKTTTTTI